MTADSWKPSDIYCSDLNGMFWHQSTVKAESVRLCHRERERQGEKKNHSFAKRNYGDWHCGGFLTSDDLIVLARGCWHGPVLGHPLPPFSCLSRGLRCFFSGHRGWGGATEQRESVDPEVKAKILSVCHCLNKNACCRFSKVWQLFILIFCLKKFSKLWQLKILIKKNLQVTD